MVWKLFFMGDDPWMNYHDHLVKPLSEITGALPHELSVMNQLTVNLHLMLVSFYRPEGKKRKILCEKKAFPSDQYTFETYVKHLGLDPDEIVHGSRTQGRGIIIRLEDICETIEENQDEIALVFWGGSIIIPDSYSICPQSPRPHMTYKWLGLISPMPRAM